MLTWECLLPDLRRFEVEARTKSEARAAVKKLLRLRHHEGLPAGTRLSVIG